MTQSLMSIAQIIAPAISGILIEHRMLTTWALVGALFAAIGLFWCFSGRETTFASGDASVSD
jgi:hypothetical protein